MFVWFVLVRPHGFLTKNLTTKQDNLVRVVILETFACRFVRLGETDMHPRRIQGGRIVGERVRFLENNFKPPVAQRGWWDLPGWNTSFIFLLEHKLAFVRNDPVGTQAFVVVGGVCVCVCVFVCVYCKMKRWLCF